MTANANIRRRPARRVYGVRLVGWLRESVSVNGTGLDVSSVRSVRDRRRDLSERENRRTTNLSSGGVTFADTDDPARAGPVFQQIIRCIGSADCDS